MFCTNCGTKLDDDMKFCTQCGKEVKPAGEAGKNNEGTSAPTAAPSAQTPETPAAASPAVSATPAAQRKKTPIIIGVCVVVVVAIAAALIWLFAFGGIGMIAGDSRTNTVEAEAPSHEDEAEMIKMPSLEGLSLASALDRLDDAGLEKGTVTEEPSYTVPKGDVISQSVAAGKDVAEDTKVDLVVSAGAPQYTYKVVGGLRTWEEAQAYCEKQGGSLACIHDQEEWSKVLAAAQATNYKVFWLGGYQDGSSYEWVDGSPFSFTAWASGEPNNDQGIEDKLVLFDVRGSWAWYDVPNDLGTTYSADKCALIMQVEVD